MPKIKLTRLKAINNEDNVGCDHPYLKLDGDVVWGPERVCEEFDIEITDVNRSFSGSVTVELWEEDDVDGDDLLGRHSLKSGSGSVEFTRDGAHYTLGYAIK
ncbi:hypothetical protein E1181_20295 [Saccharopolyspora terrae]|uniref:Uncharacterized protein n=1 Tax=Saccharopolyspora terrae TaxID=2530384 RepID=A0A4R4VKV1_9PSEU|nr:hypothetical protein [Saccharopolyspora terrae]TDD03543.1 hypothetical protein E1181_20295 [Saccharopolyspora terrae]